MITYPSQQPVRPVMQAAPMRRPGNGTRLTWNRMGQVLSAPITGPVFDHPWRAARTGNRLRIRRGLVELQEPVIGKVKMSTTTLALDASKANKNGESWVCVEVEPNKDGRLDISSRREIVQTDDPLFYTPTKGRFPIVMVLWRGRQALEIQQVAFWNPRYEQTKDSRGVRHFFL